MTAPLRNTELGDHCVNHGGVWSGWCATADDHPICDEVLFGFSSIDDLCRFVRPT
jgi:hypothetical protein